MKASFENCMELINSSIDKRENLVDEYSKLLAELLASVTWTDSKGNRYLLSPSVPPAGEKVIGWHTQDHGKGQRMCDNIVAVVKHIIVTTSDDPEETLEEFVHYICTKILPEFRDRGTTKLPHYLYV